MTVASGIPHAYEVVKEEDIENVPVQAPSCQWTMRALMLVAWVAMIVMNFLVGFKIGATSNAYPTRITPAGYAFMIWNPIFSATLAFVIYSFVNRGPSNSLSCCMASTFILNCLCNGAWGFVFTSKMGVLSVLLIMTTLFTNLKMYSFVFPKGASAYPEWSWNYWCRRFAWSIYTAWMVVATLVNIEWAQQLYGVFVSAKEQNIEGIVFIGIAVLIGLYLTVVRDDIVAVAVLLWTFIAIAVHQVQYQYIFTTSVAAAGVSFALIVVTVLRRLTGRV